jgi:hypothetical protein
MNEDILSLNYKKPKRLDLVNFIGKTVAFVWASKVRTGIITKVWRNWDGKETIKIEHDDPGKCIVTSEYCKKEFENLITSGRLKIL